MNELPLGPKQRAVVLAFALACALFLSYFSIRNACAAHFAPMQTRTGLERAVQLEPGDARNWYLLGRYWQYNLEEQDDRRAIHAYLTALALNPLSANAWLDLATAYESKNDLASARDAFLQARKAYPLSPEVSWRYGNFLLRQGELEAAFPEIRRAVEIDPGFGAEAFSRCLRAEPDVDRILDRALPANADVYLGVIWEEISEGQTEIALKVWGRLAAMHPRLRLPDVFALIGDLRARNRIREASRVWDQAVTFAGMANLQGPPGSVLWDGGFESGITGGGFAWLFPQGFQGFQISFDSQEKHSGNHSLRLTFDGRRNVSFSNICHYVPVEGSTAYRFSAWEHTRALETDQGIRFQLRSLGGHDDSTTVTPDVHGSEPWTKIEISWTSGNDVQELQVCLLRYPSSQEGHRIRGTVWIDDVALVPESTEQFKP
jgi:tetratricopeptide repeat protein